MHTQIQPNCWSCLPTAFAMALDVTYRDILHFCGHDGSEIVFPDETDPHRRRAFHAQEMMTFAMHHDVFVTPIEMYPRSINVTRKVFRLPAQTIQIMDYMALHTGVIVGTVNGNPHAVMWDGNLIYDPNGSTYEMSDKVAIEIFFACNSTIL